MKLAAVAAAIAVAFGCASSSRQIAKPLAGQQGQRACLHGEDESSAQRERRLQAIGLVRAINGAQYNLAMAKTGKFQPLANLKLTTATPDGFEVVLSTDGATYAFAVKDTHDPCLFAFFSDHKGVIFHGRVIQ